MGNFLKTQNMFSFGEVAPEFYAANSINGLSVLENMDVLPSGGLKRRSGLKQISQIPNDAVQNKRNRKIFIGDIWPNHRCL